MTGPRLIRVAEARRMPWKNGGGETIELLAHPPGAGLDAFDWRVSMAKVASDGPFSAFPGVERTLTVLDGAGLDLVIDGAPPVRVTAASNPYGFQADASCHGRLVDGPVTDLNVMTRRGRFVHSVTPLRLEGRRRIDGPQATILAICLEGEVAVEGGPAGGFVLGHRDMAVGEIGQGLALAPGGATARVLAIDIRSARQD